MSRVQLGANVLVNATIDLLDDNAVGTSKSERLALTCRAVLIRCTAMHESDRALCDDSRVRGTPKCVAGVMSQP